MRAQVAEDIKTDRLARLQTLLEAQKQAFNRSLIGKTLPILIERAGRNEGQIAGRSPYLQSVHMDGPARLIGGIAQATIRDVTPNALTGVLVDALHEKGTA